MALGAPAFPPAAAGGRPRSSTAHFLGLDDVLGIIWDGIKWVAEKAAIIAEAVVQAVKAAAKWGWDGLKWFAHGVAQAPGWLKEHLTGFVNWWKTTAMPWLARMWQKVDLFLHDHFQWLFDFVHNLSHILKWTYDNVIRPLMKAVDVARAILRVLADLGVKWAGQLEQLLSKWEFKLLSIFHWIQTFVNNLAGILDSIVDPKGGFSRNPFLWTHWRLIRDLQYLGRVSGITHNPYPEALRLAVGTRAGNAKQTRLEGEALLVTPDAALVAAAEQLAQYLEDF